MEHKYIAVYTKSKSMNNGMLDLQIVNNNKEEIEKRLKDIITKLIMQGEKKHIVILNNGNLKKITKITQILKLKKKNYLIIKKWLKKLKLKFWRI